MPSPCIGFLHVTIVSRTTPDGGQRPFLPRTVVADKEAITLDLEDLNGETTGDPDAFSDPTGRRD